MKIQDITNFLETIAPKGLQENYDNVGLLTGSAGWECTGVLTTLDATEAVVLEAVKNNCNLKIDQGYLCLSLGMLFSNRYYKLIAGVLQPKSNRTEQTVPDADIPF